MDKNANRLFFIWNIINLMWSRKKGACILCEILISTNDLAELPQVAFDVFAALAPLNRESKINNATNSDDSPKMTIKSYIGGQENNKNGCRIGQASKIVAFNARMTYLLSVILLILKCHNSETISHQFHHFTCIRRSGWTDAFPSRFVQ